MDIFFGVIIGILVLTLVVTVHEFGHFIVAKRNGVRVLEFGIGFPPKAKTWLHVPVKEVERYCKKFKYLDARAEKILARARKKIKKQKKNETKWMFIPLPKDEWYEETDEGTVPKKQDYLIFSINWLPIGGFCQMDGETNIDTRKGTFGAASFWSKTKILFAGVAMNWLLAFVIFTILAWTGMPEMFDNQYRVSGDSYKISETVVTVKQVVEDSPADKAGFLEGDTILSATDSDGESIEINSVYTLTDFNEENAGEEVEYLVRRTVKSQVQCIKAPCPEVEAETEVELPATLNNSDAEYRLGISMGQSGQTLYRSTWSAPIVGAVNTVQLTGETYRGIGKLIGDIFSGVTSQFSADETVRAEGSAKIGAAGDSVSGPVGIVGVLFPAIAQTGLTNTLYLMAIISISLACMNVLPIPALDGGRWFLIALFRLLKRPLTPETENKIVSRAFAFLLILAGIVTILDVMKIIG